MPVLNSTGTVSVKVMESEVFKSAPSDNKDCVTQLLHTDAIAKPGVQTGKDDEVEPNLTPESLNTKPSTSPNPARRHTQPKSISLEQNSVQSGDGINKKEIKGEESRSKCIHKIDPRHFSYRFTLR